MNNPITLKIRELNDTLRTTLEGGRVIYTTGIQTYGHEFLELILAKLKTYDRWSIENDPHGEHDLMSLCVDGIKVLAKIDYYDTNFMFQSDDPADPNKTERAMTIMLVDEY